MSLHVSADIHAFRLASCGFGFGTALRRAANIVHPCQDVSVIRYVVDIPSSIYNQKQAQKSLQGQLICISETYCDYFLYEIMRRNHIEYEIHIHNNEILE